METGDGIIAGSTRTIECEIAGAHVHPTQACRRDEHVHQAHVIHDNKIMPEGAELNMDISRSFGCMYRMGRLLARRPGTSLGILDKYAKCDLEAIWRYSRNATGI